MARGFLADAMHELVGYKAGLAVSLPDLCDLLSGSEYPDLLRRSEKSACRIKMAQYANLYLTILHKIGYLRVKYHAGGVDVRDVADRLTNSHGPEFAAAVVGIYCGSMIAAFKSNEPADPESMADAASRRFGVAGAQAVLEIVRLQEETPPLLSLCGVQREWTDVLTLDGLFTRATNAQRHGTFLDQRFIDFLSNNLPYLEKMHWRKFEELVAEYFQRQGCQVDLGPGQNDDGVDIRVWIPTAGEAGASQLHLVQCKRQKKKVDKVVVKGLYADVQFENADLGVLVTTSSLSNGARKTIAARGYPIEEVESEKVAKWLAALRTPGTGIIR